MADRRLGGNECTVDRERKLDAMKRIFPTTRLRAAMTIASFVMIVGTLAWSAIGGGAAAEEKSRTTTVASATGSATKDIAAKLQAKEPGTKESAAKTPSADSTSGDAEAVKTGKGKWTPLPTFTPEREAAALTFVAAHHPELSPLLAHLKKSRPNEYQRVIRKIFVDSERLAQSREAHPRRYELELKDWQFDSRIQLLVARLTMGRTPALEQELRRTLEEQLQARRDLLALERDRVAARLATLDKDLANFDVNREQMLDERFNKAINSIGEDKKPNKTSRGDGKSEKSKDNGQ